MQAGLQDRQTAMKAGGVQLARLRLVEHAFPFSGVASMHASGGYLATLDLRQTRGPASC